MVFWLAKYLFKNTGTVYIDFVPESAVTGKF